MSDRDPERESDIEAITREYDYNNGLLPEQVADSEFPTEDWRAEVAAGETLLGYPEWAERKRELRGEALPTRQWRIAVRRQQDGEVIIRESDLDLPTGATFDMIRALAENTAASQAERGLGVGWDSTAVTIEGVTWI